LNSHQFIRGTVTAGLLALVACAGGEGKLSHRAEEAPDWRAREGRGS